MNNPNMDRSRGTKWFTFYTKVRPWLGCIFSIPLVVDFFQYIEVYTSYWWMMLYFFTALAQVILGIVVFIKSKGDYIAFIPVVNSVLIYETISTAYCQGVRHYIQNEFDIVEACIVAIIILVILYFVWYLLNIKYFNRRILQVIHVTSTSNDNFVEAPKEIKTTMMLTEELPTEDTQPLQQPQIVNVAEPINTNNKKTKKKKVRYCSRCGSLIDNETKQCTGCGKKYFKGIRFNKIFFIVLSFSLALLMAIAFIVYQYNEINVLKEKSSSMQSEISSLNNQISTLKTQKRNLEQKTYEYEDLADFVNEYIVFVEDDGTKLYHKYECYKFKADYFWVFNIDAAIDEGYKKCNLCHNQESNYYVDENGTIYDLNNITDEYTRGFFEALKERKSKT